MTHRYADPSSIYEPLDMLSGAAFIQIPSLAAFRISQRVKSTASLQPHISRLRYFVRTLAELLAFSNAADAR